MAAPFVANATDRWNAVALGVLLMVLAAVALVHLTLPAAAS
jgi:hypothetical protein